MPPNYKVVVLGEGAVGKTSIILQFINGKFNQDRNKTVNASCSEKVINFGSKSVNLSIWDTAGQGMFDAVTPMYYRDADGAILVYDITQKESFNRVNYWLSQLNKFAPKDIVIQVVGNKIDRESERKLPKEKVKEFCKRNNILYEETSAKKDIGVTQMFRTISSTILDAQSGKGKNSKKKKLKDLKLSVKQKKRNKKCCS